MCPNWQLNQNLDNLFNSELTLLGMGHPFGGTLSKPVQGQHLCMPLVSAFTRMDPDQIIFSPKDKHVNLVSCCKCFELR